MNRFVAIDFETSGLEPGKHAPVQIGVAVFEDGQVTQTLEMVVAPPMRDGKPSRSYEVAALEVSGMTWTRIKKDGLPPRQICDRLAAFAQENFLKLAPVVAFNAPFDFAWYSDLLFLAGQWNHHERRFDSFLNIPFAGHWQCVRIEAIASGIKLAKFNLDSVAAHYGLSREGEKHGALEDAILAGRIHARLS